MPNPTPIFDGNAGNEWTPPDVTAFSGQKLGATTPNQTDLAARQSVEIKAVQDFLVGQTAYLQGSYGANLPIPPYTHFELLDTGWTAHDFYGAGGTASHATDQVIMGAASFKLVTPSNNSRIGYWKDMSSPLNLSAGAMHLWVRSSDLNHLDDVGILMATDNTFAAFFQVNLKDKLLNANNNEWTEITLTRKDFTVGAGSPNWNSIGTIMLRGLAQNTFTSNIWFSGFGFFADGASTYVSIHFDDGFESTLTEGSAYMDKYGFKGNSFVMPARIGTVETIPAANYMSQAQIDQLHENGWDISGHGYTSFLSLTEEQRRADLLRAKSYLRQHGYRGQDFWALIQGHFNRDILRTVQRYFPVARGLERWSAPTSKIIPSMLPAKDVNKDVTTSTVQGWIDNAILDKSWLCLTFHNITPGAASWQYDYPRADFRTIIDYLATQGVKVLPMSEVLRRL